ncbi:MAG TPA: hypothetical protein VFG42_21155 [Baekduia sp.]|uniref:hypothetical protein n=1 Tax=Baekduia sp. TaxID=2600305 RepID=UPI002D7A3B81|nr:hypothetical protein [Baekduia sp.]HET6509319.1 hypothetical protein [Baekduia sp.]
MTVALSQESTSLRARRDVMLLIALMLAGVMSMAAPLTSARAYSYKYFEGVLSQQQQTAGPSYPSMAQSYTATFGVGPAWVAAAAHVPGGWTLYGSYLTGYGSACHSYATGNPLGGMAMNAELYSSLPMWAYIDTTAAC